MKHLLIFLIGFPFLFISACGSYQNTASDTQSSGGATATARVAILGDSATVDRVKASLESQISSSPGFSMIATEGNSNLDTWVTIGFVSNAALSQFQSWVLSQKIYKVQPADSYYLLYISATQAVRVYAKVTGAFQAQ